MANRITEADVMGALDLSSDQWDELPDAVRQKAADLVSALADLLAWEKHMGGWDARCWHDARQLLNIDRI